jgi:hypothetical protein
MDARILAAIAGALFSSASVADQLTTAQASMVPLVYQDAEGYKGCGLRVLIASMNGNSAKGGEFAVTLFTRPVIGGLAKAGGMRCESPCNNPDQFKYIHGSDFQISSVEDGVPLKIIKTDKAEEPVFTLLIIDGTDAIDLLMKLRTGVRLQYGFQPDDSKFRETYSFVAEPMAKEEEQSFDACIKGVLKE